MQKTARLPSLLRTGTADGPLLSLQTVSALREIAMSYSPGDSTYLQRTTHDILLYVLPMLRVEAISLFIYDGARDALATLASPGAEISGLFESDMKVFRDKIADESFRTANVCRLTADSLRSHAYRDAINRLSSALGLKCVSSVLYLPFHGALECEGVFRLVNRLSSSDYPAQHGFSNADLTAMHNVVPLLTSAISLAWGRKQYNALHSAFSSLPSVQNTNDLCSLAAKTATQITNSAACNVYIVDPNDPEHLRLAGSWGFSKPYQSTQRFAVNASISGNVATSRKSVCILDLSQTPGVANRDVGLSEGLRSCVAAPVYGTTLRGCLATFTRDRRSFQPLTVELLETLGSLVGSILQARTDAIHSEKLTQVLQLVGHSLRSPLAAISRTASDLTRALKRRPGTESELKLVENIKAEKTLAARRSETLLYVKKGILSIMGIDKKSTSLASIVNSCVERLDYLACSRSIKFRIQDGVRNLPPIQCDPEKIELVVENLLENALKYSWKGETVEVGAWWSEKEIRLSIADKGLGVKEEDYKRIFTAFTRSELLDSTRYIKGTGLGLEVARTIVEAHNGRIWVKSEAFLSDPERISRMEGFTTTFIFSLPR